MKILAVQTGSVRNRCIRIIDGRSSFVSSARRKSVPSCARSASVVAPAVATDQSRSRNESCRSFKESMFPRSGRFVLRFSFRQKTPAPSALLKRRRRVPFRVPLKQENRQTSANGRKRRRRLEDGKSLRLREMIAKPLISLAFAKSRSQTPTLSANLRQTLATLAATVGRPRQASVTRRLSSEAATDGSGWQRRTS
jgi:hypothetical protein